MIEKHRRIPLLNCYIHQPPEIFLFLNVEMQFAFFHTFSHLFCEKIGNNHPYTSEQSWLKDYFFRLYFLPLLPGHV